MYLNSVGALLWKRFVQKLYLRMKGLDFYVQKMPPSLIHIRGQMSMYVDICNKINFSWGSLLES